MGLPLALLLAFLGAGVGVAQRSASGAFRGESCARCHAAIRDRKPGAAKIDVHDESVETHDVIIVGAGVSGLSAAYSLKGYDFLLLEKEDRVGGKAALDDWSGRRYTVAASYIGQPYLDEIKGMFRDLGLSAPVIPRPENAFVQASGRKVFEPLKSGLDQLTDSEQVKRYIMQLNRDMGAFAADALGAIPYVPRGKQVTPLQRELDKATFYDYMRGHYGDKVAQFSDQYSRSLFGVGAKSVSALAGLVFFSSDFSDSENVTWPQGPGIISEKLAQRIGGDRIRTFAFVTAVSQRGDGVDVAYEREGKRRLARAKAVIMAVPSFVGKKLVIGLPAWKSRALSKVRYSSYAIGIVALDKPVDLGAWDLWSGKSTIFTDLEPLDWPFRKPGQAVPSGAEPGAPAQLLKVYMPMGEGEGRRFLLNTSDEEIRGRLTADLEKVLPGIKGVLHGVRIVRWGHAMPVDYPDFMTQISADVAKPVGRVLFAGVDSEMPCIEGAVVSGYRAARQARELLGALTPSAAAPAPGRP